MRHVQKHVPAAVPHEDWLLERLRDPELAAEYLNAALAEGDQAAFMLALRDVAKARGGVAAVARDTGLNRVALWRSLSVEGNPELGSLSRILEATGLRLVIASAKKATSKPRAAQTAKATARR
jgi:probable addiction module antidote protein